MEVEPRSRAMRRAKDDARRKRRTTVIDSSQCQYSPGPGALVLRQLHGVPARRAARRHALAAIQDHPVSHVAALALALTDAESFPSLPLPPDVEALRGFRQAY